MTIPLLADLAALLAASAAWRVSRPIAVAIALAAVASLVHAVTGFEALRWSSALVGLVGVAELWGRARVREGGHWYDEYQAHLHMKAGRAQSLSHGLRIVEREWHERWDLGRPDALAVLCLASMAGDGAALLLYRGGWPWVFDAAQILVSAAVIAVCWPRRRT